MLTAAVVASCLLASAAAPQVASDEEVLLLPTIATPTADGASWRLPIHAWIFEPEDDSRLRGALAPRLAEILGLDASVAENKTFRERTRLILADNESGKRLSLLIGEERFELPLTGGNGRTLASITLTAERVAALRTHTPTGDVLPIAIAGSGERRFEGRIHLARRDAIAVISDIDDTIKVSEVRDRAKLVQNTFVEPFRSVEGMAARYETWARDGACFVYLSMTPWHLAPALDTWLATDGFPRGELVLRDMRIADGTAFDLFEAPEKAKPPLIQSIIDRLPEARFAFLGDSGQSDPEIYAEFARRLGDRVALIAIRNTTNEPATHERWKRVFAGLPRASWIVFDSPNELPSLTAQPSPAASGSTNSTGTTSRPASAPR